jgi:hypothetical protein
MLGRAISCPARRNEREAARRRSPGHHHADDDFANAKLRKSEVRHHLPGLGINHLRRQCGAKTHLVGFPAWNIANTDSTATLKLAERGAFGTGSPTGRRGWEEAISVVAHPSELRLPKAF